MPPFFLPVLFFLPEVFFVVPASSPLFLAVAVCELLAVVLVPLPWLVQDATKATPINAASEEMSACFIGGM